jgi:uracil-DNA glycosylase
VPVASATAEREPDAHRTKPASTREDEGCRQTSADRRSPVGIVGAFGAVESRATRRAVPETDALLRAVRTCHVCAARCRSDRARAADRRFGAHLIVGGRPAQVHASGIPWSDASGERLRTWMGIAASVFYDESQIAIMPMGFCYPGRGASGDRPPRRECAPLWHDRLLAQMTHIELTLLVGGYAQAHFLERAGHTSLTATMRDWRMLAPRIIPLPHPSPRNVAWFKANPWFEGEVLPQLQRSVRRLIATRHA